MDLNAAEETKLDQVVSGGLRVFQCLEDVVQVLSRERYLIEIQFLKVLLHPDEGDRHLIQVLVREPARHVNENKTGQICLI